MIIWVRAGITALILADQSCYCFDAIGAPDSSNFSIFDIFQWEIQQWIDSIARIMEGDW